MFEERTISVLAYNLYTILAEKIETILVRGVGNTRGRDFYDLFLLLSINKETLSRLDLLNTVKIKAEDRGSVPAIKNHAKILKDVADSVEITKIWNSYTKQFSYAEDIVLSDIIDLMNWVFEG
jgi:predicted nucleotidyltransferase component of viral defense system